MKTILYNSNRDVSTHASVRRRRGEERTRTVSLQSFNSRLREEATSLPPKAKLTVPCFNSRLREEATSIWRQGKKPTNVSTHASVRRRLSGCA